MERITDKELLRRYSLEDSDDAFADLVSRHLNWVYSAALRQVHGDSAAASDVTQRVFCDLAAKAQQLHDHTSLTSWLHTSTRFVAAHHLRSERRRREREEEYQIMNLVPNSPDPDPQWEELRPILDQSISQLQEHDRDVLLWRFFENLSHAEIGTRLGSSENAARMRVGRALDRLRLDLAGRGIVSTVSALGTLLANRVILDAPASLHAQTCVSMRGLRNPVGPTGKLGCLSLRHVVPGLVVVMVMVIALVGLAPQFNGTTHVDFGQRSNPSLEVVQTAGDPSAANTLEGKVPGALATPQSTESRLKLTIIGEPDGRPIPDVTVAALTQENDHSRSLEVKTRPDGTCEVACPQYPSLFQLTTDAEGWATTRLAWKPHHGETIPSEFTVTLAPSVELGGVVMDSEGRPLSGARIRFREDPNPLRDLRPVSHAYGTLETTTDPNGRWSLNRLAEENVRTSRVIAEHPEYLPAVLWINRDGPAEAALRQGNHIFRLNRGTEIAGIVVDSEDRPIPGATATLDVLGDPSAREQITEADGSFVLKGCRMGRALLTATAPGFAPTTMRVSITPQAAQFRIPLAPAAEVQLRLVTTQGVPIVAGLATLETFDANHRDPDSQPPLQMALRLRSDLNGRIVWEQAPNRDLTFQVEAKGFRNVRLAGIRPNDGPHSIVLHPAVTVSGQVSNADTGELIPRFLVSVGSPEATFDGTRVITNVIWGSREGFVEGFGQGQYRLSLPEPVVSESPDAGYFIRIDAEGFSPFVSRWIAAQEGEVQLDAKLKPSPGIVVALTSPQGSPASGAEVAILRSGAQAVLDGFTLHPRSERSGMIKYFADTAGRVRLPIEDPSTRIVVVHPSGYINLPAKAAQQQTHWKLQSWSKIDGHLESGGVPLGGIRVGVLCRGGLHDSVVLGSRRFETSTDAGGQFGFDCVPPGPLNLVILRPITLDNGINAWRHEEMLDILAEPGKATSIHWVAR